MVVPSILLIACLAVGAAFFWDVRGFASTGRRRLEETEPFGALYKKLPSWTFRAFGAWCLAFGVGQFALFAALER